MNIPRQAPPEPSARRVAFSGIGASSTQPETSDTPSVDPHDVDPHGIDPHWADLSALVSRAEANRAEMSRLQAERAELCAESLELVALRVAQRQASHPGRELGDSIPLREVLAELATALHVSERTVSSWLGDGAALVTTYPTTLVALREGRIDERHASAIIDGGAALSADIRAEYERLILPVAENETAPATRRIARVIAARLQPDIVDAAQRRALAERHVRAFDIEDGLARLLLDGPAALIHGIYDRLTSMGIAQGETGRAADAASTAESDADAESDAERDADERTLDQRRADIMSDLLLAGAPAAAGDAGLAAIQAVVQVTIPVLTLAGLDDEPALLDGESPIDAATARALAAGAPIWQRIMINPVTHEPLRVDTYRPSARLRRLISARDPHCRWPGCRRPVRRCDIDHTVAFAEGGRTRADNLEALCAGHHTLKHASAWQVVQCGGGTLEFISPTGRRHRTDSPSVMVAPAGRPRWATYTSGRVTAAADPNDPAPF